MQEINRGEQEKAPGDEQSGRVKGSQHFAEASGRDGEKNGCYRQQNDVYSVCSRRLFPTIRVIFSSRTRYSIVVVDMLCLVRFK